MKTQDRLNCMAQVIAPPVSKGYYGGTCTLAIQGSNEIQLGALKVCFPIWIMPTHAMSVLDQYDFLRFFSASMPTKRLQSEIGHLRTFISPKITPSVRSMSSKTTKLCSKIFHQTNSTNQTI